MGEFFEKFGEDLGNHEGNVPETWRRDVRISKKTVLAGGNYRGIFPEIWRNMRENSQQHY